MKRTCPQFIAFLSLTTIVIGGTYLEEASPAELSQLYDYLILDNLQRVEASGANGIVTNVFPVYMAGFLHSTSAIPILLERIDWPGSNEPEQHYYRPPSAEVGQSLSAVRVGLISRQSKPPTPSVGALTQIPVDWPTLRSKLEVSDAESDRTRLLAWVAAVKHESEFFNWLELSRQSDSNRWDSLAIYAQTNLVGRKPYYMGDYGGSTGFCCHGVESLFNLCVAEWRRRADLALDAGDESSYSNAVEALARMGEPVQKPTAHEIWERTEHVHEEENGADFSLFENEESEGE